jgi:hypothetical protein
MISRRRAAYRRRLLGRHSGPAQQVDDESDDENGSEYAAAEVHVNLRWFVQVLIEARSSSASLDAVAHSSGAIDTLSRRW